MHRHFGHSMSRARILWAIGLSILGAWNVGAATPREELLRFVPDDVAFCVVLQDLRGHAARLQTSPFLKQFEGSALGKALAGSSESRLLRRLCRQCESLVGIDLAKVRDDVLGDAVIFAYR